MGNLLISDQGNRRIRQISSATETITTIAGGGSNYFEDNLPPISAELSPLQLAVDPHCTEPAAACCRPWSLFAASKTGLLRIGAKTHCSRDSHKNRCRRLHLNIELATISASIPPVGH
jgi:hypothetical protein